MHIETHILKERFKRERAFNKHTKAINNFKECNIVFAVKRNIIFYIFYLIFLETLYVSRSFMLNVNTLSVGNVLVRLLFLVYLDSAYYFLPLIIINR